MYDTLLSCTVPHETNFKEKIMILLDLKVYSSKSERNSHIIGGMEYCCNGVPTATDVCSTQTHCWLTTADYTMHFIVITMNSEFK